MNVKKIVKVVCVVVVCVLAICFVIAKRSSTQNISDLLVVIFILAVGIPVCFLILFEYYEKFVIPLIQPEITDFLEMLKKPGVPLFSKILTCVFEFSITIAAFLPVVVLVVKVPNIRVFVIGFAPFAVPIIRTIAFLVLHFLVVALPKFFIRGFNDMHSDNFYMGYKNISLIRLLAAKGETLVLMASFFLLGLIFLGLILLLIKTFT